MTGAGSPTELPFLIEVVSAILRATLPGGTDCLVLLTAPGVTSGSKSAGSTPDFNLLTAAMFCSLVALLSKASKAASKSST